MNIKPASSCKYDLVALGECMIRLSPAGHGRIEFAPSLEVWVGGGEYNVAYALARLGMRTAWIGGLNTSPMGRIILNHGRSVGMDMSHAVMRTYDGVGRVDRIGLNFTEVGHGKRASTTLYDRGHSATAGIKPGEIDWEKLFAEDGVRWFHTGGIFAALSANSRQVVAEAIRAAHEAGAIVSYDLNFRSKLWRSGEAIETTRPLIPYIDCLISNEEDFEKVLGYPAEGVDVEQGGPLDTGAFCRAIEHPNIITVYDFGEDGGRPYMVMEFLKGEDLRAIIKAKRAANLADKLRIAVQVAKALEYVHNQKIIHRDIKPENIHVNPAGVVKMMDFGIAKTEDLPSRGRASPWARRTTWRRNRSLEKK